MYLVLEVPLDWWHAAVPAPPPSYQRENGAGLAQLNGLHQLNGGSRPSPATGAWWRHTGGRGS